MRATPLQPTQRWPTRAKGSDHHAGLERAIPMARPLTIKAPISEAAAAARAP